MDKLVFLSKTNSLSVGGDVPLKHLSVFEEIVFKFKEDGFTPKFTICRSGTSVVSILLILPDEFTVT
jgi:hypothetical protein